MTIPTNRAYVLMVFDVYIYIYYMLKYDCNIYIDTNMFTFHYVTSYIYTYIHIYNYLLYTYCGVYIFVLQVWIIIYILCYVCLYVLSLFFGQLHLGAPRNWVRWSLVIDGSKSRFRMHESRILG